MRYAIDHVLQGIRLARKDQLASLQQRLEEAHQERQRLNDARNDGPRRLADLLRGQATKVDDLRQVDRDDTRGIIQELSRFERDLPSSYELDNQSRKISQLQDQHIALARTDLNEDTRLEQYLLAVQAGGETHVSQHSLKQAGFDPRDLTAAVLALQSKLREAEGNA